LRTTKSTSNLEHLSLAEIVCFAFVTIGVLAPRWLGVARRASNCVGCRGSLLGSVSTFAMQGNQDSGRPKCACNVLAGRLREAPQRRVRFIDLV
jgi:hypothetical protein